jgi:NAD(P)H-dependent FMN reductase
MAYMNQQRKAERAPVIKAICQRYGVKATLSVRNHMTLVLTIKQGKIDFLGNYARVTGRTADRGLDVNPYWYQDHFDGEAKEFLKEIIAAMYGADYYDRSDAMTDYFDTSHYIDINIGRWDQPYALAA